MEKPKYGLALIMIMVFILCSIIIYSLLSNSNLQIMSLPIALFLLWLLQPTVAILAIFISKKIFKF